LGENRAIEGVGRRRREEWVREGGAPQTKFYHYSTGII